MLIKKPSGFFVLPKLSRQKGLIHSFSSTEFGNMSFNYGSKTEVLKNRSNFVKSVVSQKVPIISLHQNHSTSIFYLHQDNLNLVAESEKITGDGLITNLKGVSLLIKTADCLPIIIFDPKKKVVALLHAGWEGVVGKIFLQALLLMINQYQAQIDDLYVGIGPAICQNCYTKERGSLFSSLPEWQPFIIQKKDLLQVDLIGFTINCFKKIGFCANQIEISQVCTQENKNFFSHRRSQRMGQPETRFATIVCLA